MPDKIHTNEIRDDCWYYETDLLLKFGLSSDTQKRARDAGKLKYLQSEGSLYALYHGAWVREWLDNETVKSGPDRTQQIIERGNRKFTVATPTHQLQSAAVPAGSVSTDRSNAMSQATINPIQQWNRRLAEKVKAGMPKRRAVIALAREDPELHKKYLLLTNARLGNRGGVQQLLDL